jgi:hypothetical protein
VHGTTTIISTVPNWILMPWNANTVHEENGMLQNELFGTLREINFCWEYDEWHWNYWSDRLLSHGTEQLQKSMNAWLHQQRKQYRNGNRSNDRSEQRKHKPVIFLNNALKLKRSVCTGTYVNVNYIS